MATRVRPEFNSHEELILHLCKKEVITNHNAIQAMLDVDRGDFSVQNPYQDRPQFIGYGTTISAPHMHAHALQNLASNLKPGMTAMDIGTGSGYLTCAMAQMVGEGGKVIGIDHIEELIDIATVNMSRHHSDLLQSQRIQMVCTDGRKGYSKMAPYDCIHVGAAASESVANVLCEQLKNGGKLIMPVILESGDQMFREYTKNTEGAVQYTDIAAVRFNILTDEHRQRNNGRNQRQPVVSKQSQHLTSNINLKNAAKASYRKQIENMIHDRKRTTNRQIEKTQQSENTPFPSHMTMEEASNLKISDKLDHRDQVGQFQFATVIEKNGTFLKMHYEGWSSKWDEWSDFSKEIHRFAVAKSISKRPAHRFSHLKKGDFVDINPILRHSGWKEGEIRKLDNKSGQIVVCYEFADKNYLYWTHLDNKAEIAEFTEFTCAASESDADSESDIIQKAQHEQRDTTQMEEIKQELHKLRAENDRLLEERKEYESEKQTMESTMATLQTDRAIADAMVEDLQMKVVRLQEEIAEYKENEMEILDEEEGLQRVQSMLAQERETFEEQFNEVRIQQIYKESPMELVQTESDFNQDIARYQEEVEQIIIAAKAFGKCINDTQSLIERVSRPDVREYRSWNLEQIMAWITALDNGKFREHLVKLKDGLMKSQILRGELLPELTRSDLSSPPFNIHEFVVKRDLERHFKSLAEPMDVAVTNEGTDETKGAYIL